MEIRQLVVPDNKFRPVAYILVGICAVAYISRDLSLRFQVSSVITRNHGRWESSEIRIIQHSQLLFHAQFKYFGNSFRSLGTFH